MLGRNIMRIAFDIMGGDNAPSAIIEGVLALARSYPQDELIMVGLDSAVTDIPSLPDNVSFVACGSVMAMDEDVRNLLRKKDSSIWVATDLVKKGTADAIISAGSTGAQMTAATLLLSRLKGCERPAIATVIPAQEGEKLLLDAGANADCTAQMLVSFAKMGAVYAEQLLAYSQPRVALLSNGTEEHKGNKLTIETHALLKESGLNFIGNKEGRDILKGGYDVMVCDGMSGNIAIKSAEGAILVLMSLLKKELTSSLKAKLGAALIMDGLSRMKKTFSQDNNSGAPLLGVKGISIVCHGNSDAKGIISAGELAKKCFDNDFVTKLASAL